MASRPERRGWRFLVDRGGTFTDVVAQGPGGELVVRKLLSQSEAYADATVHAMAGHDVHELRMGTTVATNALLERRGERVRLITTRGFGDLLEIGHQERPDIFALEIHKRQLLHAEVREVDERILADGTIRRTPSREQLVEALRGAECVAVLFLNACVDPRHELLVADVAQELGCRHVALSHRVTAEVGAVSRGDTTVADAYLTPLLRRSVEPVLAPERSVRFMQSSGGLTDARHFSGKDAILSGPAGGAIAVARVAAALAADGVGDGRVIGLDMGGTSTDVCRCDGEPERSFETVTAGVRIRTPMLHVVTVAAGGGSLLHHRDGRFQVGPQSAGADPGPACYGRGGPATLTDANLVLGRVVPDFFPHLALDREAARERLAAFGEARAAAEGFVRIANENMAAAIRQISTARGYDVRDHVLCAFGGAAPQHACALATRLGMRRIVIPPLAGVLSAHGMGLAYVTHHEVAPMLAPTEPGTRPPFPADAARAALREQGVTDVTVLKSVDARYVGVDDVINVPWDDAEPEAWRDLFLQRHRGLFGFVKHEHPIELVNARVDARGQGPPPEPPALAVEPHTPTAHTHTSADHDPSGRRPVFLRAELAPGAGVPGPALIVEQHTCTVVDDGWVATVDGRRNLVLQPRALADAGSQALRAPALTTTRDPIALEIMANRFMSLAGQMGEHLRRVAHSTNIKERLDFSCALFDADGGLVANAPHIPVHLGAMGETVRCLRESVDLRPGDAWLTNDPYRGGSHLPDLTVVSPVFRDGRLAFFVANRGHHADVGGSTPGSMPPDSRTIHEEGVLFSDFLLARDGSFREDAVVACMRAAGVRNIPERLSDLRSQLACNTEGARLLDELCDEYGLSVVHAWMGHVKDNAREVMQDVIANLHGGSFEDRLDDGSRIRVAITVEGQRARVDFHGTSAQQAGNRNAPRAVTIAAVLYVFRTLAARPIPLNAGCLEPLEIVIPEGSLLDPRSPAAVVGGNVETSQRVVDVLYGALDELAASQGTMNNLTFGDESFGYYETICGGAGAGDGFHGASAVHTHMTNTRITDPEVLEQRYPVVVERFAIRRGSGGRGTWNGGDGVIRELSFLRPLRVSLLAERRSTRPFGLRADAGLPGVDLLSPHGVRIETPGGGGYTPRTGN